MYDLDAVFANVEQGHLDNRSQIMFVLSNSKLELRVLPWCIFLGFLVTYVEGGDRESMRPLFNASYEAFWTSRMTLRVHAPDPS
jgi:hypothetical protein